MSKKIFIDIGHGGSDPGALAINGLKEKDINLLVGLELKRLLVLNGFEVKCSREKDINLTITERANLANVFKADLVISVHHNAGGGDGYEIIHSIKNTGKQVSDLIGKEFELLGQNKRRIFSKESEKFPGLDWYGIIRYTKAIAIITEYAFLDSVDIEIVDEIHEQKKEALAIAKGVCKYYNVNFKDENITEDSENLRKKIQELQKEIENLSSKLIVLERELEQSQKKNEEYISYFKLHKKLSSNF